MLSHPGPYKNHVNLMHRLYRKSRIYVVKWRWFLQPITSKNDITLCKLDVNVKNRTVVTSLNLSRNSLKEKVLLYSKFHLKIQMWKTKRYARKSIYHGCMVWIEKSVTRDHCPASLGKPRDADQWPSWQIFLSTPYTHERYLYYIYSRLSLSRLRLSRITAYLEEKIWSLL